MTLKYDAGEVITAMVTPFDKDLKIDEKSLVNLINHLVENGSDGILAGGTTGESPTLTPDEIEFLYKTVKDTVNGRAKVVFGAGSNCTENAVKSVKKAQKLGADVILSVAPYYNKPSQDGIYAHFAQIAKSTDLPVIVYNIPGRTGICIKPSTIARLANDFENIIAVKQCVPDLNSVTELKLLCPEGFLIYSGDDSLTLPMLSLGAHGVISVASHVKGKKIKEMISLFKSGDIKGAEKTHYELYPLFDKLFMCPNPVPVKELLSSKGIIENFVRLPLVTMNEAEKKEFYEVVKSYGENL